MFDKLVDEWLSNLKEKPDWLHVEACLVNNQNFQAPLEPQAAAELLCSTWFHDFEAKFAEIEEAGKTTLVAEKTSEEETTLKTSLATLARMWLEEWRKWRAKVLKIQDQDDNKCSNIKEVLMLKQPPAASGIGGSKQPPKTTKGKVDFIEHRLEYPIVDSRFFFGLCPVKNLLFDMTLKACSGCNSVCYSDKESQKSDWKRHKGICKALQPLVAKMPGHHPLHKAPEKGLKSLLPYLQATLKRDLTQYEQDLLSYPRLCNVCLDGNQSKLKNCEKCLCVAYCSTKCSEEDKKDHEKSCFWLKTILQDYLASHRTQHDLARKWKPRPYLISRDLPLSIQVFFQQELQNFCRDAEIKKLDLSQTTEFAVRQLTFEYTCQLTAFYGAQRAYGTARLSKTNSLVIHVVGARQAETLDLTRWEIFCYQLPKLLNLIVVFIGPELVSPYPLSDFECASEHLKWARSDRVRPRYVFINRPYHEFVENKNAKQYTDFRRPDLVLALNCGFIFYQQWDRSLPSLIKYANVPLIFTEYYEEDCKLDLQKLDSQVDDELEIIVEPSPNPYCSALPARIPTSFAFRNFNRRQIIMSNDFICIVQSQSG